VKKFDSINIIPFVDVLLVLLAIVITTSVVVKKQLISVSLPSSTPSIQDITKKSITLTIKKNGDLYFQKEMLDITSFKNRLSILEKESNIVINCDKDSRFESFVLVLDILKSFGLNNLSIVTKDE
jgi:biopolymer transport protein ExbD